MKSYVICDHAQKCGDRACSHGKPRLNTEVIHARCARIDEYVNIRKVDDLPKGNPNRQFRRKKHGF